MKLEDSQYAVIGAGSGIGRACADLLAARGAGVQRYDLAGSAVGAHVFDVTSQESWAELPLENCQGMVVTAGIRRTIPIEDMSLESFNEVMSVNALGAFLAVKKSASLSSERMKDFSVVLLSSAVVSKSVPGQIAYNASKAAIASIAQSAAKELGARGIRINAVAPGSVLTPMTQEGWRDAEHSSRMRDEIPAGRAGCPDEIASIIAFLLSEEASYVNGSIWHVDGGWTG